MNSSTVFLYGKSIMNKSNLSALVMSIGVLTIGSNATAQQVESYTVKPGDTLQVSVWKEPDLQGPVLIRPDGRFTIPLVGEIDARGKNVGELQTMVSDKLKKFIADPVVTISVQEV